MFLSLAHWVLVISQDRNQKRSPETNIHFWLGIKPGSPTWQVTILPLNNPGFLRNPEIEIARVHHKN